MGKFDGGFFDICDGFFDCFGCVKPFDAGELNARVRAACARTMIDGCTGLGNRACFDQRLQEELATANQHAPDFSLVLLDLDHFKPTNDKYRHPFGDHLLQKVDELFDQAEGTGS